MSTGCEESQVEQRTHENAPLLLKTLILTTHPLNFLPSAEMLNLLNTPGHNEIKLRNNIRLLEGAASEEGLLSKFLLGKGRKTCYVLLSLAVEVRPQRLHGTWPRLYGT